MSGAQHGSKQTHPPTVLRLDDVAREIGISKALIKRLVAEGDFPKPIKLSERARGWRRREILDWVENRETADSA